MQNSLSYSNLPYLFIDAFQWLCRSRTKYPSSSDIWDFRRSWCNRVKVLVKDFVRGKYRFGVQKKIILSCGGTIALWSSRDALVIKVLTAIIQEKLKPFLSKTCYHLKGHGGLKKAVRDVVTLLPKHNFFCKTDVKLYYDSIDHFTLFMKLYEYIIRI